MRTGLEAVQETMDMVYWIKSITVKSTPISEPVRLSVVGFSGGMMAWLVCTGVSGGSSTVCWVPDMWVTNRHES